MSSPEERRDAASKRAPGTTRRVAMSSLAPTPRHYKPLGASYSALSVKVPEDMAISIANVASDNGTSVSDLVRTYIQKGLDEEEGNEP